MLKDIVVWKFKDQAEGKSRAENWAAVAAGVVIIVLLVWGYRRRRELEILFAGPWY